MIRKIAAGWILLLAASSPETQDPRPDTSGKPEAPIALSAQLDGHSLIVDVAPAIEGEVSIDVTLPEGVSYVRGDRDFRGPLRRGQSRRLALDFSIADNKRREILVSACVTCEGARLTRVTSVVLNEDGSVPGPQGVLKTNARGEKILEFGRP